MLLTETGYPGGMRLPSHSHATNHLAILTAGSYVERIGDSFRLYLPGDAVPYPPDILHENLIGSQPSTCLNLEFPEGESPQECLSEHAYAPAEIGRLLATGGKDSSIPAPTWLLAVREAIDDDPALSLAPLSDRFSVHRSHLARSFHTAFGLSVGRYARLRRLRRAADLLTHNDAGIAEIAADCGFYDQSHFSNAFQVVTGYTPGTLRRIVHA